MEVKRIYFYLQPHDCAPRSWVKWAQDIVDQINADDDIFREARNACEEYCDKVHTYWAHIYDWRIAARQIINASDSVPRYSYIKNLLWETTFDYVSYEAQIDLLSGEVRFIEV